MYFLMFKAAFIPGYYSTTEKNLNLYINCAIPLKKEVQLTFLQSQTLNEMCQEPVQHL